MKLQRIDVVSIPVRDQSRAKDFYVDVLGFKIVRDNPMGPDRRWVQLGVADAETSITLVDWFDTMPPGCVQGLVLTTTELDETYAEMVSRGLQLTPIKEAPWGRYATFRDPDGNGWVLQAATSD